jgi:ribonuclease HI
VIIYLGHSCLSNPGGSGGWSFVVQNENKKLSIETPYEYGGSNSTTSNRMELTALYMALIHLQNTKADLCYIISNSRSCVNSFNTWIGLWADNDWTNHKGKKVENIDLLQHIFELKQHSNVKVEWNNVDESDFAAFADSLATKMSFEFKKDFYVPFGDIKTRDKIAVLPPNSRFTKTFIVIKKFKDTALVKPENGKGRNLLIEAADFPNYLLLG